MQQLACSWQLASPAARNILKHARYIYDIVWILDSFAEFGVNKLQYPGMNMGIVSSLENKMYLYIYIYKAILSLLFNTNQNGS